MRNNYGFSLCAFKAIEILNILYDLLLLFCFDQFCCSLEGAKTCLFPLHKQASYSMKGLLDLKHVYRNTLLHNRLSNRYLKN